MPSLKRHRGQVYLAQIEGLNVQVTALDQRVKGAAKETEAARRTQTLPDVARSSRLAAHCLRSFS
jgi:transposase